MNMERVIKRAQAGDAEAISDLYQLHADAIYRYVLYRVPTDTDAEDLTAEVFLKMIEGLPDYQFKGIPFEAWLYRIAAARVADFHRSKYRHPQTELNETLADQEVQPEEKIEQSQEIEDLRQVLSQFSEEEQTLLILRFVERKSHRDVAAILGKTPAAVKAAQHRVLVQLASLLGTEDKVRHYLRGQHD